MKKKNAVVINHKVDRRKRNQLLIVTVSSDVAASAVTFSGAKMKEIVRKRSFRFDRHFPFIHKRITGVYMLNIKDKPSRRTLKWKSKWKPIKMERQTLLTKTQKLT